MYVKRLGLTFCGNRRYKNVLYYIIIIFVAHQSLMLLCKLDPQLVKQDKLLDIQELQNFDS